MTNVYLGRCHLDEKFHTQGERQVTVESELYEPFSVLTDEAPSQDGEGKFSLIAAMENNMTKVPYQAAAVPPFFCGDPVKLLYDSHTHEMNIESMDREEDWTWCLSPILRRTRSSL